MSKVKRKVHEALEARRANYDAITASVHQSMASNGLKLNRPGSQNRKKGYGAKRGRR